MSTRWLKQEVIITRSQDFFIPQARNQEFQVTIWGAGGSGSCDGNFYNHIGGAGGGAGEMKSAKLTLEAGGMVQVNIGKGGQGVHHSNDLKDFAGHLVGRSGTPTTFGSYLFANGGGGGNRGQGGFGCNYCGGDTGCTAQGGFLGYGISKEINGIWYHSGGGAGAVNGRGIGGYATRSDGNGGLGAGGCGCFVQHAYNTTISRRIGSGGDGCCVITYYAPID